MPSADPASDALASLLPGAGFADVFSIDLPDKSLAAEAAARAIFSTSPRWIRVLMALRNVLVAPFGLKTGHAPEAGTGSRTPGGRTIGWFPVLSRSAERVVLGLDDRHLDFRLVIETRGIAPHGTRVSSTTLVRTNNRLGRAYLALVMPFHKRIVPAMLRRLVKQTHGART